LNNLTKSSTAKPNANTTQTEDNSNTTLHGTTTTEIFPRINQTDAPSNSSDGSGNGASNTICLEVKQLFNYAIKYHNRR
jgi:hypothetical protein